MKSLSKANETANCRSTTVALRSTATLPPSKSSEALQKLCSGRDRSHQPRLPVGARPVRKTETMSLPINAQEMSRVELLLSQKGSRHTLDSSVESAAQACEIKTAIKRSSQWTDVQQAVASAGALSASNAAYALQRLGCLNSYASRKRRAELAASGLVPTLFDKAASDLANIDPGSLASILDGCARLQHVPSQPNLLHIAAACECMAQSFASSQLPVVLWSFSTLAYVPPPPMLAAFDQMIPMLLESMSPQGISLSLSSFQAADFRPSHCTLSCAAEALYRKLPVFKPSEIAACVEAFCAFNYHPADHIVTAVLNHTEDLNSAAQKSERFQCFFQIDDPQMAAAAASSNLSFGMVGSV